MAPEPPVTTTTEGNSPFSAATEARVCEIVLGDRRHGLRAD
ncbi:hypothetical protein [Umezawaea sp. Da 62-37]|nr:hypothetical protein [Umezawaea sp. Da 62-37]WNV86039.1 hypothetical protein RM788_49325 [Umezawaea sp. Da 62-37]